MQFIYLKWILIFVTYFHNLYYLCEICREGLIEELFAVNCIEKNVTLEDYKLPYKLKISTFEI